MRILQGIAAAPGMVCGYVRRIDRLEKAPEKETTEHPHDEWLRARKALQAVQSALLRLSGNCPSNQKEKARIVESNAQILDDPELHQAIRDSIYQDKANAEWAIHSAFHRFAVMLAKQESEYLKARSKDLVEMARKALAALDDRIQNSMIRLHSPAVLVASDLSFADLAGTDEALILGICLAGGNGYDHALIMARCLGIPAVLGLGADLSGIKNGNRILVDGDEGRVIVDPDAATIKRYRQRFSRKAGAVFRNGAAARTPVETLDGARIRIMANVSSVRTALAAKEAGAEGIGLLRTEFLFANHRRMPDEEEQYQVYQELADVFPDGEVTIRLFDTGSDKPAFGLAPAAETNPALGIRGIRLALSCPDIILKPQLRAILRIRGKTRIKIMLPLVTNLSEIRRCRQILDECRHSLSASSRKQYELGIMIEVPSAAIMSDQLAPEVDFFSIGTNDLTQFIGACDRTNPSVSDLAGSVETAVIRLIRQVIRNAHRRGRTVGLCGEWGQNPLNLFLLVGLGIDQISVNHSFIYSAKTIIGTFNRKDARRIVNDALKFPDVELIHKMIRSEICGGRIHHDKRPSPGKKGARKNE